jgi:hypothetical protein
MTTRLRNIVGLITCALLAQAALSGTAVAQVTTYGAWSTSTRKNIKVYFCPDTFTKYINLGTVPLRENIKQALADWTAYSKVDIAMSFGGTLSGTTNNGCGPSQRYKDGTIVIRAEDSNPGDALAAVETNQTTITKQSIAFYARKGSNGESFTWTLDSASPVGNTFIGVLLHELGHTIGLNDYYYVTPATRMYGVANASVRVLWDADFAALRGIYNLQARTIKHMRSTDLGSTWAAEGNVTDTSNNRIAVAYDSTLGRYGLAWTGSNWVGNINTMVGNGVTFSSKVTHNDWSHFGPTLAYGNGLFVMAYVSGTDSRHILYKTSSDGVSWGGTSEMLADGTSYGSMWEPVLAYNANRNTFVLAWADLPDWNNDDQSGVVKFCTSSNPSSVPFGNCGSTLANGIRTAAAPGLACHDSTDKCLLTWTNHNGVNSNQINYDLANVDATGLHLSNSVYPGEYTKLTPSVGFAQGKFLMGWLGVESPAGYFVPETTYPQWGGLKIAVGSSPPMNVAPTMVYGTAWSEVAYYYLTR